MSSFSGNSLIKPHGGYRDLKSYQNTVIIYDATTEFCERYVNRFSRTVDQMVQAARSGKQNITEGNQASGTSKKTEIKLVGVARASLEELLEDYQDFLRQNGHAIWEKDDCKSQRARQLAYAENRSYVNAYQVGITHSSAGGRRQYDGLPDSSDELFARPATWRIGKGILGRRWIYGENVPRSEGTTATMKEAGPLPRT